MSSVVSGERFFAVKIINCEYYFLTNLQCVKCFEKKYKCKTYNFSAISEKNIKEWKLITKGILTGNCSCKNY
jgi:hypothetical protein